MNEVRILYKTIDKMHIENQKRAGANHPDYFKGKEDIKKLVAKLVDDDFGVLDKKAILQLVYYVYHYNVMKIHTFAIKCDRQLGLLNT